MSSKQTPSPQQSPSADKRKHSRRQEDRRLFQRERELQAVRQICLTLFQQTNLDLLLEKSLSIALEVVNAQEGSILLADAKSKTLVFRHTIGEKAGLVRGKSVPWKHGIVGAVFTSRKPEVIADAKKDPRHFSGIDNAIGFQTRDMIVMPLQRLGGETIGVLTALNKRDGRLNEDDVAVLTIVAALSAELIEQARLYEEAKLAEVGRLLGDIGHDVKNMIQPVVLGTTLLHSECLELLDDSKGMEDLRAKTRREYCDESLATVNSSLRRIQDRFKEIADCVKGLSAPPEFTQCRVAGVVTEVFGTLRLFADEKHVSLRATGLESLPPILADDRRLYNAFFNLVNNALHEVSPGGRIAVGGYATPERKSVLLWVADTGTGMPREVLNSLFTPRVVSRKTGGTGLGTKIVKDVVDAHHGQIHVESEEGVGTTFYINLPFNPLSHTSV